MGTIHRLRNSPTHQFANSPIVRSRPWSRSPDVLADLGFKRSEVLDKHASEPGGLYVVVGWLGPCFSRLQHVGWNTGAFDRDVDVENRIGVVADPVQRAGKRAVNHRARMGDLHPPAGPISAAAP